MIANGWRRERWGNIATLEYGRALRERQASGPVPVFGTNGQIGWTNAEPMSERGGVIIGRKGAYRGVHYSAKPFSVIDTAFWLRPRTDLDLRWAYYELLTHDINGLDTGSAIPSTTRESFYALPVDLPPPNQQHAIARVLGSLDDKIDLNRRVNQNLESLAQQALTRLKSESAKTMPLKELGDITMGQSPPGETYNSAGDGLPFYQGSADFTDRYPRVRIYCSAPTRVAAAHDVLLSVRAPVGDLNVAERSCAIGRGVAAIRPRAGQRHFLYYLLRASRAGWHHFNSEGTVFGSASRSSVQDFPVQRFKLDEIEQFESWVTPIDELYLVNVRQNRTLAELRDLLLPKLVSGEIRIKDAEKTVESGV